MGKLREKKVYTEMSFKLGNEARERLKSYATAKKMAMTVVVEDLILGRLSFKPESSRLSDLSPAESAVASRLLDEAITSLTELKLGLPLRPAT